MSIGTLSKQLDVAVQRQEAGPQTPENPTETLSKQLEFTIASLKDGLIERDTEARLMLLAALCGEHILFIGPPGTAKSELGRRLSFLCKGGSFFERLLTRFTVPEVSRFSI
jgi:MoxR-like ATPase